MAAPTRVAVALMTGAATWANDLTKGTTSLTWLTGDVVIVLGMTADNAYTLGTPTTGGAGLTFAAVSSTPTNTGSSCKAYAWIGTASSGGSGSITSAATDSTSGIIVFQYRASDGLGNTAISAALGATTTQSLTRAGANSAVVQIWGDWSAINDTAVTWTPATGNTQSVAVNSSGNYTVFVGDWTDEGSAGATSYGFTGHAGGADMSAIALEIKGSGGGGSDTAITPAQGALLMAGPAPVLGKTILMPDQI